MSEQLAGPSESPERIASHVERDVFCRCCGYNLRSLPRSALCPECGVSVARSLRDNRLVNANPIWLTRLRTGIGLLTLAVPLRALLILVTQYGGLVGLFNLSVSMLGRFNTVASLLEILVVALLATACWLLTTPEPGLAPLERDNLLRKRLRIVAVAYVMFSLSSRVIWSLIGLRFGLVPVVSVSTHVILLLAGAYCLFTYLAALIDRTPTRRGAGLIRILRFIYLPIMAIGEISDLFLAWGWYMNTPPLGRMQPIPWWGTSAYLLGGAAGLIATIIFVTFLARFYFDLDRICKVASVVWSDRRS